MAACYAAIHDITKWLSQPVPVQAVSIVTATDLVTRGNPFDLSQTFFIDGHAYVSWDETDPALGPACDPAWAAVPPPPTP